jgi:hypothetical protein
VRNETQTDPGEDTIFGIVIDRLRGKRDGQSITGT